MTAKSPRCSSNHGAYREVCSTLCISAPWRSPIYPRNVGSRRLAENCDAAPRAFAPLVLAGTLRTAPSSESSRRSAVPPLSRISRIGCKTLNQPLAAVRRIAYELAVASQMPSDPKESGKIPDKRLFCSSSKNHNDDSVPCVRGLFKERYFHDGRGRAVRGELRVILGPRPDGVEVLIASGQPERLQLVGGAGLQEDDFAANWRLSGDFLLQHGHRYHRPVHRSDCQDMWRRQ